MNAVLRRIYLFLLCFLWNAAALAQTPDTAREKRWADEITPAILVGDAVYLAQKSGHKFLAIYAANAKARAGVIVVHGMGVHPDWGGGFKSEVQPRYDASVASSRRLRGVF